MGNQQNGFINIVIAVVVVVAIAGYVAWDNNLIPKNITSIFSKQQTEQPSNIDSPDIQTTADLNTKTQTNSKVETTKATSNSKVITPAVIKTNTPTIQTPKPIDLTNWKTYTNYEFKFTLKLPPNMVTEENPGIDNDHMFFNIYVPQADSSKPSEDPSITMSISRNPQECQQLASKMVEYAKQPGVTVKNINGNTFYFSTKTGATVYGVMRTLYYIQNGSLCKIIEASVAKSYPANISMDEFQKQGGAAKLAEQIDIGQSIPVVEAILGSMKDITL